MPSDATKRLNNYTRKLDPARIGTLITAMKPAMLQRVTDWFRYEAQIYGLMLGVLGTEAVSTLQIPGFWLFCLEVMSLKRRVNGAELAGAVAVSLAKYRGRGLREQILIKVRDAVFSIPSPGGGPEGFLLVSPALDAEDVEVDGSLTWGESAGADDYDVYLAAEPAPPALYQASIGKVRTFQFGTGDHIPLLNSHDYYWMIRAKNSFGFRDSPIFRFTTVAL
jgi:hypothetical protein